MSSSTPIAVLGTGSWGTALAMVLARNGYACHLWGFDPNEVEEMNRYHCSIRYLPGIRLPDNLKVSDDLAKTLQSAQDILIVVPSFAFRQTLQSLKPFCSKQTRIVWGTKGLDSVSSQLLSTVVEEIFGIEQIYAVISGPSFAKEVAAGLPTAVTAASQSKEFVADLAKYFNSPTFRIHCSDDVIGVQIGSVVKNVIAVATGISDGLGFGTNARSALITGGLAEITRLGIALGGKAETFTGLSGLGDLVLTCTDNQSRNKRFGIEIGRGTTKEQATKNVQQTVEGARNAAEVYQLAQHHKIKMPIVEKIYRILYENVPAQELLTAVLNLD